MHDWNERTATMYYDDDAFVMDDEQCAETLAMLLDGSLDAESSDLVYTAIEHAYNELLMSMDKKKKEAEDLLFFSMERED